jgi:prepilin-type N-terminal cleavage/methylation domain-containing protein
MRRDRGFTLIEFAVAVAVVGILAVASYSLSRAGLRNANLGGATHDLALPLSGLRSVAMAEGEDYLLVFADAPDNDASECRAFSTAGCAKYFVLRAPPAAWTDATVRAFDVDAPGASASLEDSWDFPRGVRLHLAPGDRHPPPPFEAVALTDAGVTQSCADHRRCFAIRYSASGRVEPVVAPGTPDRTAFAFGLRTDLAGQEAGADHRGVVLGFPTGLTKVFSF